MSDQPEHPEAETSHLSPADEAEEGVSTGSPPRHAKPPRRGLGVFLERYMVVHLIAYPLGGLAAVVGMPFTLWLRGHELNRVGTQGAQRDLFRELAVDMGLGPVEAAQMELVTETMIGFALLMMVIPHLAGVPWAWVRARPVKEVAAQLKRERRSSQLFWGALGSAAGLLLVGLLVGYGWFFIAL